jgi:penicillin-binding protein 1B
MFRRRIFGQIEPNRPKFWRYLRYAFLALALFAVSFIAYLDYRVRSEFEGRRFALPARIYAQPIELRAGLKLSLSDVADELRENGYRDGAREGESGWFQKDGDLLEIAERPFVFWDGPQGERRLKVVFAGKTVARVQDHLGQELPLARLEPLPIGGIYPGNNHDRDLVRFKQVPPGLVQELLATEDRAFYTHHGYDLRGIARAAWSFVRGKGLQGGSTLTQQLVKNFFLTPERTISRKVTELVMAVLLEAHYGKEEILETYLNEIYLGQDRDRAIHGVGLGSQHYFAKPVEQLTLAESAVLVALVKGPSIYDPLRHPQKALERRNLVLRETRDVGSITMEQYAQARGAPLGVTTKPATGTSPHPAFVELVYRHLRRDYAEADLRSEGLRIFTTLDPRAQARAEGALERKLAQFDRDKRFGDPGLEGAVVVTDTQTGEVQALVGGRDVHYRGFNRALDAARPVGSLLKPAVYLTALADPAKYTLLTPLDDGPFVWKSRGAPDWSPANYDRQYHGAVPGDRPRALVQRRHRAPGHRPRCEPCSEPRSAWDRARMPLRLDPARRGRSLADGVSRCTDDREGGFRARAARIRVSPSGRRRSSATDRGRAGASAEPVYLITAARGVVRKAPGGAQNWVPPRSRSRERLNLTSARRLVRGVLGDRLAVVWIGYDDNRAARLTGAAAALPVWGELMASLDPEPLALPKPEGIETVLIDPQSGLRADSGCDGALELPFANGSAPVGKAPCASAIGTAVDNVKQTTRNWWQKLWGR